MQIAFAVFLCLCAVSALACPDYEGKWSSSREMTMSFNNSLSSGEPKVRELLPQITGTVTVEYTNGKMVIKDIPKRTIILNGEEHEWFGMNEDVDFELLGCTDTSVAIKYEMYDVEIIEVLYFPEENVHWVYLGTTNQASNAHAREYFVRAPTPTP